MATELWHARPAKEALVALGSSEHGLAPDEAARRLAARGPNALPEAKVPGYLTLFLRQFQSPLIYVLFAAAAIVFAIGDHVDAAIVVGVLVFNSIVGAIQEGRAQNTLRALKKFSEANASVLRGGVEVVVPDRDVVPGDVIVLKEGAKVPADARIFLGRSLRVDEASLTGESEPVPKLPDAALDVAAPVADRATMVYKGSNVAAGSGLAVAVATGLETEIGQVARQIVAADTEVPLRAAVRRLSRVVVVAVAALSLGIFAFGVWVGYPPAEMLPIVVSLAVSVIPEGLPIALTVVLATGVWRMARRNVLVKRLQAVEALGQATVVAVDKTGTITRNELVVQRVWVEGQAFEVGGVGYDPVGEVHLGGSPISVANHPGLVFAGRVASFCADARPTFFPDEQRWRVSGDPTEAALLVLGQKLGFVKEDLEAEAPLVESLPFDYALRYHATVHRFGGGRFLTVVGAPEAVLSLCSRATETGRDVPFSDARREAAERAFAELSAAGLRVLAFATTPDALDPIAPAKISGLTFGGFFGMKDGLRAEVRESVAAARGAGVRVVMLTGDHRLTARAVAEEAGIWHEGDRVVTGAEVDAMGEGELASALAEVSVFARVTPAHKLRLVRAYRARGEIVAMTGDGVNDAPSLVAADLGVGMGRSGTDVAKEAADIVLLDDDFRSVVAAIEEGRGIYRSIQRVVLYLFSTGFAEVLAIVGALALGLPVPLLAAQIIWLNFVTDGFLVVALAIEPRERGLLSARPSHATRWVVDGPTALHLFFLGIPMAAGTLALFASRVSDGSSMPYALTVSLTTLAAFQWWRAWSCRSSRDSGLRAPWQSPYLLAATALVVLLQVMAVYAPFMNRILGTAPISARDWAICVAVASSLFWFEEARKLIVRRWYPAS